MLEFERCLASVHIRPAPVLVMSVSGCQSPDTRTGERVLSLAAAGGGADSRSPFSRDARVRGARGSREKTKTVLCEC